MQQCVYKENVNYLLYSIGLSQLAREVIENECSYMLSPFQFFQSVVTVAHNILYIRETPVPSRFPSFKTSQSNTIMRTKQNIRERKKESAG